MLFYTHSTPLIRQFLELPFCQALRSGKLTDVPCTFDEYVDRLGVLRLIRPAQLAGTLVGTERIVLQASSSAMSQSNRANPLIALNIEPPLS